MDVSWSDSMLRAFWVQHEHHVHVARHDYVMLRDRAGLKCKVVDSTLNT
jgi:hypothetical protein